MARLKLKLQLYCGDEIAMGPGKADLLEAIARDGSISAAGRDLGMSYRRAWLLVDTMNRCFRAAAGRDRIRAGGRTRVRKLTAEGEAALTAYRALSAQAESRAPAGTDYNDATAERSIPKPALRRESHHLALSGASVSVPSFSTSLMLAPVHMA